MRLPPRGEGWLGKKEKKKKTKYDRKISHYSSFLGSKRTAKCYREKKKWNGGVKKEVKKQEKRTNHLVPPRSAMVATLTGVQPTFMGMPRPAKAARPAVA